MKVLNNTNNNHEAAAADDSPDEDDSSSVESGATDNTSRSGTPTNKAVRSKKRRSKLNAKKTPKIQYKFSSSYKEDHGLPLFGVQFNHFLKDGEPLVFASVGGNRISIYECLNNGKLKLLQSYTDPDPHENLYTCAWSMDDQDGKPILAVAGSRGVIRILSIAGLCSIKDYTGHGHAINELKFHPRDRNLLLSVSKDHTLRLWNIKADLCVAIFGGVDGHRDEVLSADFDCFGHRIMSCGMDHSLKLWNINRQDIQDSIKASYAIINSRTQQPFVAVREHYPDFSTRDIHRNYVDCVKWFGDLIISKSCDECMVCWKPGRFEETELKSNDSTITLIHKIKLKKSEIWFVKFSMDVSQRILALGNKAGQLYVWDFDVTEPSAIRYIMLAHPKCITAIRQTSVSRDGSTIVCVCDDGTIWRWDRVQ